MDTAHVAASTTPDDLQRRRRWTDHLLTDPAALPVTYNLDGRDLRGVPADWQPVVSQRPLDASFDGAGPHLWHCNGDFCSETGYTWEGQPLRAEGAADALLDRGSPACRTTCVLHPGRAFSYSLRKARSARGIRSHSWLNVPFHTLVPITSYVLLYSRSSSTLWPSD